MLAAEAGPTRLRQGPEFRNDPCARSGTDAPRRLVGSGCEEPGEWFDVPLFGEEQDAVAVLQFE
jgi:hypothetical protein